MGYIHCCGGLHKCRTFHLMPQKNFTETELDYLKSCPVCGHTVVQITRIDSDNKISVVRKVNKKALEFFKKLKNEILYEIKPVKTDIPRGSFYLNYNEYGVRKRCYSNLSALKIGLPENKELSTAKTL